MASVAESSQRIFRKAYQLYRSGSGVYKLCMSLSESMEPYSLQVELFMDDAEKFKMNQRKNVATVFGVQMAKAADYAHRFSNFVDDMPKDYKRIISARKSLKLNNIISV